jgi:hypothetical protein
VNATLAGKLDELNQLLERLSQRREGERRRLWGL